MKYFYLTSILCFMVGCNKEPLWEQAFTSLAPPLPLHTHQTASAALESAETWEEKIASDYSRTGAIFGFVAGTALTYSIQKIRHQHRNLDASQGLTVFTSAMSGLAFSLVGYLAGSLAPLILKPTK